MCRTTAGPPGFVNEIEAETMAQAADSLRRRGEVDAAGRADAALDRLRQVRACDCSS